MDLLYEQETSAFKSEAKVVVTSSEDTSFSNFIEPSFKKDAIRY